jgi:hypothetical protein
MKFAEARPYADPDAASRKLIEIANSVEAVQDGRGRCGFQMAAMMTSTTLQAAQ